MNWTEIDTWIVVIGSLCAITCALPGCFLLLRGVSMMGDAISHAVLPGLALAFMLTKSRLSIGMFIGAAVVGVLTAAFTQWISKIGKVERGASMGIVFTTLFAIGLILIVKAADYVDIDPECVLYGSIELSSTNTTTFLNWQIPQVALSLGILCLINLVIVVLFFKELRLSSFDPALANVLGFSPQKMQYLLMILVAISSVACFEAVGSIIVIAMLIVPAACAFLMTRNLSTMLAIACLIGVLAAFLGHLSALFVPRLFGVNNATTSAGMMAVALGFIFAIIWLAKIWLLFVRRRHHTNEAVTA